MSWQQTGEPGANSEVFTVSALNRSAKSLLERAFPQVFVEGEISNFSVPASGHWYLTLKDESGQLRTAMFKNRNQRLRFKPRNGLKVIVRGKISLYEARGEYQFIAEHMEEAGEGELRRAFEQLKNRLQAAGYFDEAAKQPLPELPQHLAIITSPTGAAVQDVLSVIKRRFPALKCTIIPTQVQGDEATAQVVRAIALANTFNAPAFDAILLTRGGGSLEDLWTFNTEPVALAIAASTLPVVSAIGHESDITIADFVADLRAATPSAAAEVLAPDQLEWFQRLDGATTRLERAQAHRLKTSESQVKSLSSRLRNPGQTLTALSERFTQLQHQLTQSAQRALQQPTLTISQKRLGQGMRQALAGEQDRINQLSKRVINPSQQIDRYQSAVAQHERSLSGHLRIHLDRKSRALQAAAGRLNALSPLSVLERGYALVRNEHEVIVRRAADLTPDQAINITLADGEVAAKVINTAPSSSGKTS